MHRLCCLLVPLILFPIAGWGAPPTQYTIVALDGVVPHLTKDGMVVGARQEAGQLVAYVLYPTPQRLGTLPDGLSATAHGALGDLVVGESGTGNFGLLTHAFRFTAAGGIEDLGTVGDVEEHFSTATDTNAQTIVGYGDDQTGTTIVAVRWPAAGGAPEALPTLGGTQGFADAINAAGLIVGSSTTASGQTHAALWQGDGSVSDLTPQADVALALAISDAMPAQVVGMLQGQPGTRGFRVTVGDPSTLTLLDPLPEDSATRAEDISSAGDVVGTSQRFDPQQAFGPLARQTAVLWEGTGLHPVALLTRVADPQDWTSLEQALGVTDVGIVVGLGTKGGQRNTPFVLVPVASTPPTTPETPKDKDKPKSKEPKEPARRRPGR